MNMDEDFEMPEGMNGAEDDGFMDDGEEEAVSFMKEGDETEIGTEGLKKKLIKEGQGFDSPDPGDEVQGIISFLLIL